MKACFAVGAHVRSRAISPSIRSPADISPVPWNPKQQRLCGARSEIQLAKSWGTEMHTASGSLLQCGVSVLA
jgi:hypothetical protein